MNPKAKKLAFFHLIIWTPWFEFAFIQSHIILLPCVAFSMDHEIPDYDMDSEDESWLQKQSKKMEVNALQFEEMMDRLEKGSGQTVSLTEVVEKWPDFLTFFHQISLIALNDKSMTNLPITISAKLFRCHLLVISFSPVKCLIFSCFFSVHCLFSFLFIWSFPLAHSEIVRTAPNFNEYG